GTWFSLGDALQRFPKIRIAYLAGDFSTNRMSMMVRAAQAAPGLRLDDPPDDGESASSPDADEAALPDTGTD
ncbi:HNH endonuclease, partial [Streptomyces sp. SID10244]|nr:HNH endonuclease [Streptomyces sp. SID10244]